MLMWTLDKFVKPDRAAAVFQAFSKIGGLSQGIVYLIGSIQLCIILGLVIGWKKRWTYLLVLLFHYVSTFSAFGQYLATFDNLLLFAACPVLAACFSLYFLRDVDTLWTVKQR